MLTISSCPVSFQIDGLVQDCSNSSANALELLQSCTKPSKLCHHAGYIYSLFQKRHKTSVLAMELHLFCIKPLTCQLTRLPSKFRGGLAKINGLMQERHNFIANALELHISCTEPSK